MATTLDRSNGGVVGPYVASGLRTAGGTSHETPFAPRHRDRCPVPCKKPSHCEGCDQCDPSTRTRHARLRETPVGMENVEVPVRYCDDCTTVVNAGTHDTLAEVVR